MLFEEELQVGEPVSRDDGRFYVPVTILCDRLGLSPIVFRVASDAFPSVEDAQKFAQELVNRWNVF
jgi:hypothetical protein